MEDSNGSREKLWSRLEGDLNVKFRTPLDNAMAQTNSSAALRNLRGWPITSLNFRQMACLTPARSNCGVPSLAPAKLNYWSETTAYVSIGAANSGAEVLRRSG